MNRYVKIREIDVVHGLTRWVSVEDIASEASQGPPGPAGPQGAQGAQGNAGSQGPPGANGQDGAQGATGPQGVKGDTGDTGPQGIQGATGSQGPVGDIGPQGETGAQGTQGIEGPAGPQGQPGDDGAAGAEGPQGETGETGSQGPQGNPGTQGIQGPPGQDGAQGQQGQQGIQGNPGNTGAQGATGPLAGKSITLIAPNDAASAAATNLAVNVFNAVSDPSYRQMHDLRGMTKVRIMGRIGGTLVAATKLRVQYHLGVNPAVATGDGGWTIFADTAGSHTVNVMFYSAEINIPAGAQVNNVLLRVGLFSGDGVADPTMTCAVMNVYV